MWFWFCRYCYRHGNIFKRKHTSGTDLGYTEPQRPCPESVREGAFQELKITLPGLCSVSTSILRPGLELLEHDQLTEKVKDFFSYETSL